jgi:hypothetical protein
MTEEVMICTFGEERRAYAREEISARSFYHH